MTLSGDGANCRANNINGRVVAPLNSGERHYQDAIEWLARLDGFYGWMMDGDMQTLVRIERERLSHRLDALEAVRLGTLKSVKGTR